MIERKIYNGWAFTENEREKEQINKEIYNELKAKYKIRKVWESEKVDNELLDNYDLVYSRRACYGHGEYLVYKKPASITRDELLLIFDEGNLCFGGNWISGSRYRVDED